MEDLKEKKKYGVYVADARIFIADLFLLDIIIFLASDGKNLSYGIKDVKIHKTFRFGNQYHFPSMEN